MVNSLDIYRGSPHRQGGNRWNLPSFDSILNDFPRFLFFFFYLCLFDIRKNKHVSVPLPHYRLMPLSHPFSGEFSRDQATSTSHVENSHQKTNSVVSLFSCGISLPLSLLSCPIHTSTISKPPPLESKHLVHHIDPSQDI